MDSELLFQFDKDFNTTIIGTDEAGRGPAAGGVFATFDLLKDFIVIFMLLWYVLK